MENVDFDGYGYYSLDTGAPVELIFDDLGTPYNAYTGQPVNLIGQAIQAAQNTLIGIFGRQGYPPDYDADSWGRGGRVPVGARQGAPGAGPQYGFSPGGVTPQGFQINWWAAGLIGLVVGAFVLGKRR